MKDWFRWLWEIMRMGKKLAWPGSKSLATMSGVVFLVSAVWLIYGLATDKPIGSPWVAGGGAVASVLFLFLIVAPYAVWKRDIDTRDAQLKELELLKSHEERQRGHEKDWLFLYVLRFSVKNGSVLQPSVRIVSALTYSIEIQSMEIHLQLNRVLPNEPWVFHEPFTLSPGSNFIPIPYLPHRGTDWQSMVEEARDQKTVNGYIHLLLKVQGRLNRISLHSETSDYYIG